MDMKKYFIVSGLTAALCSCAACGPPPAKRNFNETEYSRESEESSLQDTISSEQEYAEVFPEESFATEEELQMLKAMMEEIDFTDIQDFPVDPQLYGPETDRVYKEAFYKALTEQTSVKSYRDRGANKDGRQTYYRELVRGHELAMMNDSEFLDVLKNLGYHYLDWEGDGLPELVVHLDGFTVLKYEAEEDAVYVLERRDAKSDFLGSSQWAEYDSGGAGHWVYDYDSMDREGNKTYFGAMIDLARSGEPFDYWGFMSINGVDRINIKVTKEYWEEMTKDFLHIVRYADQYAPPYMTFEEIFGTSYGQGVREEPTD